MDKKTKSPKKTTPKGSAPGVSEVSWPTRSPNAGINKLRSAQNRKPVGRGAARGR